MHMFRKFALLSAAAFSLVLIGAGPAQAIYYGNPSPDVQGGEVQLGIALSEEQVAGTLDLGIGQGNLGFLAGTYDAGLGISGTEVGVGYKHKLGEVFKAGRNPVRMGVLGGYSRTQVESTFFGQKFEFNIDRLYFGAGATMTPVQRLNLFGSVIYERASYKQSLPILGEVEVVDSNIGLIIGAEYWITPSLVGGAELHPGLYSDDLVLFGGIKF